MMKRLGIFAFIALVILSALPAMASCGSCGAATASGKGKEIVVDDNAPVADDKEFGVNAEKEMPETDSYDQNTGLPNTVGSDTNGEIE